jgi:hypothetical protein
MAESLSTNYKMYKSGKQWITASLITGVVSMGMFAGSQTVNADSVSATPVSATPVSATPVSATPVSATPVSAAPVSATPVSTTPVSAAPVSATPVSATPVSAAPVSATPVSTTPVSAAPVSATPVSATPVSATPTSTAPVSATPVSATPVSTTPTSTAPVSATPVSTAPVSATPVSAAPVSATPVSTAPTSKAPVYTARLNIKSNNNSVTANDVKTAPSSILSDTTNYLNVDVQYINDHNALGIAALFSVFAKTAKLAADVNGNIAVQNLIDSNRDFGTRENNYNLTKGDLSYIQNISNNQILNDRAFRSVNSVAILGEFIKIVKNSANQIEINGGRVSTLNEANTFQDAAGNKYIDFDKYFATLYDKAEAYSAITQSEKVITNFSDNNQQVVDVSKADQTQKFIYVDIDYSKLAGPQPITIKGLSNDLDGPTVIFNVKHLPNSDISVQTQINYTYANSISVNSNGEDHTQPNHVLWNFGTTDANININSGRLLGSVLAPKATINVGVNIDGNIVGANVNITGGETHRWDVQTPSSEVPSSEVPSSETPSSETPSSETPSSETPSSETPSSETPSSETPSSETPSSEVPSSETPSSETPSSETPSSEVPSSETPSSETPSSETPSSEVPSSETPSSETPSSETPSSETPSSETPSSETPSSETPSSETPSSETPSSEVPSSETPSSETPSSPIVNVTYKVTNKNNKKLPDTGENKNNHTDVIATALLIGTLGITAVARKKKGDN